ncbi:unnamed protein product [Ceratitis capitata]|uniref:(Mediterranean fruit fly) hypothetical protein n=1 Tax=Ceratitis capitata TaxID=7213 RepID=A0A811V702_CERCA|nr:unnamed protein product [Ceratitis capitata]
MPYSKKSSFVNESCAADSSYCWRNSARGVDRRRRNYFQANNVWQNQYNSRNPNGTRFWNTKSTTFKTSHQSGIWSDHSHRNGVSNFYPQYSGKQERRHSIQPSYGRNSVGTGISNLISGRSNDISCRMEPLMATKPTPATHFASSNYFNAPPASELPTPPRHWLHGKSK